MAAQLNFNSGDFTTFGTTGNVTSVTAAFSKSAIPNMVVGDLIVAWIHNQSSGGGTITAPSGWTRYGAALGAPSNGNSRTSGFYYYAIKTQVDLDNFPATSTWTFSISGNRVACVVSRATGIDLNVIEDSASTAFQSNGGTAGLTITGISTTNATTLLVGGLHHQNSASTLSPTTTSFMTAFQEYKTSPTGSANANSGAAMGYTYLTSSGATGNVVAAFDGVTTANGGELVAFTAGTYTPPPGSTRPAIVGTPTTVVSQATVVNSFSINTPAGLADGDLLLTIVSAQSPTVTGDFTSSGWTRVGAPFEASSAGHRILSFYTLPVPSAAALAGTPSFTFTSTDTTGGRLLAECLIIRGADLAQQTLGTPTYSTTNPANQVTNVQPDTPAYTHDLLLVAYNAQFTSAIDYSVASAPNAMTLQADMVTSTAAVSKTRLVVYQQDVEAAAITQKSMTWAGVESQGAGTWVVFKAIATAPTNDGVAINYTSATDTLSTAYLFYTSATDTLSTPAEVRPFPKGYPSVATMLATNPFYCAHRGGSDNWPEMSLYAYSQAGFWGVGALEVSLARTSDGVWFGLHDSTLDRTSGTTGFTAAAHTWAEVQAYAITSAGTTNTSVPAQPYMRWEEIIAAYYNTHVLFIDPKVAIAFTSELLNMMDALPNSPTSRLVGKYYGVSGNAGNTNGWAHDASARGYKTWGYFYQADVPNLATYQGRWDILGMDYTADAPSWAAVTSYGKPVMGHIIPALSGATTAFGYGAVGVMVSGVQEAITRSPSV